MKSTSLGANRIGRTIPPRRTRVSPVNRAGTGEGETPRRRVRLWRARNRRRTSSARRPPRGARASPAPSVRRDLGRQAAAARRRLPGGREPWRNGPGLRPAKKRNIPGRSRMKKWDLIERCADRGSDPRSRKGRPSDGRPCISDSSCPPPRRGRPSFRLRLRAARARPRPSRPRDARSPPTGSGPVSSSESSASSGWPTSIVSFGFSFTTTPRSGLTARSTQRLGLEHVSIRARASSQPNDGSLPGRHLMPQPTLGR